MRRLALVIAAVVALALPASAGAQGVVTFGSVRCEQGGVPFSGSGVTGHCTPGIFVVGEDGSGLRRLTTGGFPGEAHRSGDFGPAWSHDGRRIAFSRQTNEGHGLTRLFVMDADGTDVRRMLPASRFDDERDPSWSPRADLIAFQGRQPNSAYAPLYAARSDGSELRRLSPKGWTASAPTFTPDGRGIAFVAARPVPDRFISGFDVWLTDAGGRTPVQLTMGDIPIATNAIAFSPGAKYLAVTLYDGSLYTVRTDGGQVTRLTRNRGFAPDWAATGDTIFYTSGPSYETSVIKSLGFPPVAAPRAITAPGAGDSSPDWAVPGTPAPAEAAEDEQAPVAVLGEDLDTPPSDVSETRREPSGRSVGPAQLPGPRLSKIPFLVMDRSGIRRVEAAAGLRVEGGCRFLQPSRRPGARRACSNPTYLTVRDAEAWKRLTAKLPRGRYEVRFRTLDVEGNRLRRPRPRVVRVP